jgi:hypothetical protein
MTHRSKIYGPSGRLEIGARVWWPSVAHISDTLRRDRATREPAYEIA